jgi:UDP-glucose 4-epimerase
MKAGTADRFYNVGTGRRTSLRELAELLLDITGSRQPIRFAERNQATLVRNRIGSPLRASAEIGFTAGVPLRQGLERLVEWRASHKAEVEARRQAAGVSS